MICRCFLSVFMFWNTLGFSLFFLLDTLSMALYHKSVVLKNSQILNMTLDLMEKGIYLEYLSALSTHK